MRNPGGYFITFDPGPRQGQPKVIERDTFKCSHCGAHKFVKPLNDPAGDNGICHRCHGLICPACDQRLRKGFQCVTEEEWLAVLEGNLKRNESRDRLLKELKIG